MKTIQVCCCKEKIISTLSDEEMEKLKWSFILEEYDYNVIYNLTPEDIGIFAKLVGDKGYTFSPVTYKGVINDRVAIRRAFRQMQMFVLDFNKTISFDEVKRRCMEYELPILFAYEIMDSEDANRFRVVFLNDVSIKRIVVADIMIEALWTIFPESDKGNKDVTRAYYGGKKLMYFNHEIPTINIELLIRNMCLYLKDRYGVTNYHRKIRSFSERTRLSLNSKGYLDVSIQRYRRVRNESLVDDNISPNSIIYIMEIGDNLSFNNTHKNKPELSGYQESETLESRELETLGYQGSEILESRGLETLGSRELELRLLESNRMESSESDNFESNNDDSQIEDDNEYIDVYQVRINKSHQSVQCASDGSGDEKTTMNHKEFRSDDLSKICSECRLINEFITGSRILTSKELDGVASSLIQVESGSKMMIQILKKHSYYQGDEKRYENWNFHLKYIKRTSCGEKSCVNFCPYAHQCSHAEVILSTSKTKYHSVNKLNDTTPAEYYSIKDAAEDLRLKFEQVMAASDSILCNHIHVINSPAGIGKSKMVLDYIEKHPKEKYLVAAPTIELKNKYYDEAISRGLYVGKSPSLVEYKDKLPKDIWKHILLYYQAGKHFAVSGYIESLISGNKVDKDCLMIFGDYLAEEKMFHMFKGTIFTTHNMVATMPPSSHKRFTAVIFDEDPLLNYEAMNLVSIPIMQLMDIRIEMGHNNPLTKRIESVLNTIQEKSWFSLPAIKYDRDMYGKISAPVDIPAFCSAEKFYFRKKGEHGYYGQVVKEDSILFFRQLRLNLSEKYVVLSATANHQIYKYRFGQEAIYYECKKAKYIGKLKQYTYYSGSKDFIKNNPDVVKEMIKLGGTNNIIAFDGEEYGVEDCHFGKTTGINTYKGKDLTVLGTYHRPEWMYKLFAYTMETDALFHPYENAHMRYQPIKYNGFKFHFMTFDTSVQMLRNIQLWMIESEQEQAVGRARLSRCDCTVTLFSNFPLRQANIIDEDFMQKTNNRGDTE